MSADNTLILISLSSTRRHLVTRSSVSDWTPLLTDEPGVEVHVGAGPPISAFWCVMFNESMSEATEELIALLAILGREVVKGASILWGLKGCEGSAHRRYAKDKTFASFRGPILRAKCSYVGNRRGEREGDLRLRDKLK